MMSLPWLVSAQRAFSFPDSKHNSRIMFLACLGLHTLTMAKWLEYTQWQGLDHVPFLQVETGIESGKNSFPQSKINMVKRRNRNQKNGCRADKYVYSMVLRQNEFSPGLSFVWQHITAANELFKEDWRMAPIRLFCPMPWKIEYIQFNSTQFNLSQFNLIFKTFT